MKIFFVEGADGAGKTTLIKKLSEYSDVKGYSSPPRDWSFNKPVRQWRDLLEDILEANEYYKSNIILIDRSPITEFVYRMVIDVDKPNMTMVQFAQLMKDYNIGILHCEARDAFESAQKRGEDYVLDKGAHKAIEEMYTYFMWTMIAFGIEVHTIWPKTQKIVEIYDKIKEDVNNAV